jgi:tight adherence protein C
MIFLIGALVATTVGLVTLAAMESFSARERATVARRMEHLLGRSHAERRQASRHQAVRSRAEGLLRSLGEHFVANRKNLEALREALSQAGYRGGNVLSMYFAIRAVLMVGMALAPLFLLPLVTESATAPLLVLPYFVLPAWFAPRLWLRRRAAHRQKEIQKALPDTLDLLLVCVEAGLGLNQALARVAREIEGVSPVMGSELKLLNLEIRAGTPREEAFRNLGARTGADDLRALATMMIQADRFGTSIAQALRVQGEALRTKRRQQAEEAAAKTTIKLVFPLVLFIFPALFVIILGPAVLSVIRGMAGVE